MTTSLNGTFARRSAVLGRLAHRLASRLACRKGNVATIFAVASVPLIVATGFGLDYMRVVNARDKLQRSIDQAALVVAKNMALKTDAELTALASAWIAASYGDSNYALKGIAITRSDDEVTVNATVAVPTTFSGLIGIDTLSARLASTATGSNEVFMNVYLLLDNSASMGLAATSTAQTQMSNAAGCVFACHDKEYDSKGKVATYTYKGVKYQTTYDVSQAIGATLRRDVMNNAAKKVISMIDAADPEHKRIKVGVYYLNTGLSTAQDLTYTTSAATAALSGTQSQLGVDGTYFDTALSAMTTKVGKAGAGQSESDPVKLVLMVSDGVQSVRSWVLTSSTTQRKVGPFNPDYCKTIKSNGATFGVLYTEYLSIKGDWGYDATVGSTMASSSWGGTLHSGVSSSTTRRDYLPTALGDCATTGYFMSANSTSEIENGLSTLFSSWLSKIRIAR
jgi:Flp pilus assembly protein TadG